MENATQLYKALKNLQRRQLKEDWIELENYVMQRRMEKQFDDVNKKEVIAVSWGLDFIFSGYDWHGSIPRVAG